MAAVALDAARAHLGKPLRLTLSDGRIVEGIFASLDKSCTIVLYNAAEATSTSEKQGTINPRAGGVVIVPGQHIIKIEAKKLES